MKLAGGLDYNVIIQAFTGVKHMYKAAFFKGDKKRKKRYRIEQRLEFAGGLAGAVVQTPLLINIINK